MKLKLIRIVTYSTLFALFIWGYFIEPNRLEVTRHDLKWNLGHKLVFAQVSDLHLSSFDRIDQKILLELNKVNPDFIVFTGDMITGRSDFGHLEEFLSKLPSATPKFAIIGNWEKTNYIEYDKLAALYGPYNCKLLLNGVETIKIGDKTLEIVGLDDVMGHSRDYAKFAAGIEETQNPRLILAHFPITRDELTKYPALNDCLVLAGHTHGGQIFRRFGLNVHTGSGRYLDGWYDEAKPVMYVNRGVGTSLLPLRFMARPEISIFEAE